MLQILVRSSRHALFITSSLISCLVRIWPYVLSWVQAGLLNGAARVYWRSEPATIFLQLAGGRFGWPGKD